jgi:hypothetical protein
MQHLFNTNTFFAGWAKARSAGLATTPYHVRWMRSICEHCQIESRELGGYGDVKPSLVVSPSSNLSLVMVSQQFS